jgi:hypothetical protein
MTTATVGKSIATKAESTVSSVDAAVGSAFLASGIGAAFFGLAVVANEASEAVHNALTLTKAVGPLSGKIAVGVVAYLLSWVILHFGLGKNIKLNTAFTVAVVLFGVALLLTFPPVFLAIAKLFAAE